MIGTTETFKGSVKINTMKIQLTLLFTATISVVLVLTLPVLGKDLSADNLTKSYSERHRALQAIERDAAAAKEEQESFESEQEVNKLAKGLICDLPLPDTLKTKELIRWSKSDVELDLLRRERVTSPPSTTRRRSLSQPPAFPAEREFEITKTGECQVAVTGYVDAQTKRAYFTVEHRYTDLDGYESKVVVQD